MPFRPTRTAPAAPRRPIAPIHRGPQAVSQHSIGGHTIQHAPNAALLIDFDNVTMGIRSDLQVELKNLLSSDIIKGKVSVQRAYADWRRYPQYVVPLAESSIDMIMATAYGSAKKNATDIRLAIDALELVFVRPEIGTFILLSGDSDFSSLVIKLKEYGKYVIGVGIRESSSDLLVMNCDEYYSYNALAGLVKSGEDEIIKRDPWELVTEAVLRMKRNGDVMRADRLKQVMQQIDSSFDEKNVGKSKFSLFVSEAARKGLLSLTKLENGQLEVDVPRGESAADTGAAVAGAVSEAISAAPEGILSAALDNANRSRRGGRGSRGRTRERDDRTSREPRPLSTEASGTAAPSGAGSEGVLGTPAPARAGEDANALPATPAVAAAAAPQPSAARSPNQPAVGGGDAIGATGTRLTREEAFNLVRRAVESAATGGAAVSSSRVRTAARSLLGRDSESLSERNFVRILHDAHDADLVDLRRRGSEYEVAQAVTVAPMDRQLEAAAAANAPAAKPVVAAPRGMGARGIGRGGLGAKAAPPAHLLSMGAVGGSRSQAAAPTQGALSAASSVSPQTELDIPSADAAAFPVEAVSGVGETRPVAPGKGAGRKRGGGRKTATKTSSARAASAGSSDPDAGESGKRRTGAAGSEKSPARKRASRPARKKAAPRAAKPGSADSG